MAKKLTYKQVERMLLDYATGTKGAELASQYGITHPAISWWKAHYSGLSAEWIEHITDLKHRLVMVTRRCDKSDKLRQACTDVIKRLQPSAKLRSNLSVAIRAKYGFSARSANLVLGLSQGCRAALPTARDDAVLVKIMKSYFEQNPGHGFGIAFQAVLASHPYTRSQAAKIYKECGYAIDSRPKTKIHVPRRVYKPMLVQDQPDQVWSMDFMFDVLPSGIRYCVLNAIDDFNREAIVMKLMPRNTAKSVVQALNAARIFGRMPKCIRTDNGAEFKSSVYKKWTERHGISRTYSRPAKPAENAYVESFNRTFRREVLDKYEFRSIHEAQRMTDDWRIRYNLSRPHHGLGGLSPIQYAHAARIRQK